MKSIQIARYGKLLSEKQTGNFGKDGFHNAPNPEGFYCFNRKHMELFLVGEKRFERDIYYGDIVGGFIWIHLQPKRHQIIKEVGGWYKIRSEDYHSIYRSQYNSQIEWFNPDWGGKGKYAKDHLELFCTNETVLKNIRKGYNKYKERGITATREIEDKQWDIDRERWEFYNDARVDRTTESD